MYVNTKEIILYIECIDVGNRAGKRLVFNINHNIFQSLHRKIEKFNPDNLFQYSKVHGCFNINPLL